MVPSTLAYFSFKLAGASGPTHFPHLKNMVKHPSIILLLSLSLMLSIWADEKKAIKPLVEKEAVAKHTTSLDRSIPLKQLQVQLRPLTKEELSKELEAWMELFQSQIMLSSEASIEAQSYKNPSDIPAELQAKQKELRTIEYDLFRSIQVVIAALEAKGGDGAWAQKYIQAVTMARFEITDKSAVTIVGADLREWLVDPEGGKKALYSLIIALLLIIAFWIAAKIISRSIKKTISKRIGMSVMLGHFIERSVKGVVIFMGLLFALRSLGVQVGPMIAAMSAGGFILGFALQDTLGNFASGMMVMFYRPFDIGHFVEVAGSAGRVDRMSLVSTTLLTPDNKELIIPNKKVWGDTIINYNSKKVRRVDLVFGIGYGDDIKKTAAVLKEITDSHIKVLKSPATLIQVGELADSSVNLLCRPWVRSTDYWDVYRELTWLVKERFDKEGISIPFPQRDLHIYQTEQAPPDREIKLETSQ